MKTIFILLLFFLGVGVLAGSYNRWTRTLMSVGIAVAILFLYLT